jgi:hypothetical protein
MRFHIMQKSVRQVASVLAKADVKLASLLGETLLTPHSP